MYLTNSFEERAFDNSPNDGATACSTIYLTDLAQLCKEQVSILSESDNSLFQPIDKSFCTKRAALQIDPIQYAYFQ